MIARQLKRRRAVRGAARPALALAADQDLLRPNTEEATDSLDAGRELQRGALAVPRLEGRAHRRQPILARERLRDVNVELPVVEADSDLVTADPVDGHQDGTPEVGERLSAHEAARR